MRLTLSLDGQTAVVTGANSGIGAAVAKALGQAGASVVVNYRSRPEDAEAVVEELRALGAEALAVQADVTDDDAVGDMFDAARARFGTVDVLVSNAGVQEDAPFRQMTREQWDRVLEINLTGQFVCARHAVEEFCRRGRRPEVSRALGKIICMSSVHEIIPWAGHVNYAAAKGGVMLFMKSLAQEVAPLGIRVNSIAPGAIRTRINREAWEEPGDRADLKALIPYGRVGEVEDVAQAAVWLASDLSDYVTGTALYVDGGMLLYPAFREGG